MNEYDVELNAAIDEAMSIVAKYQGLDFKKNTVGELTARWFELKQARERLKEQDNALKTFQEEIEPMIIQEMETMDVDKLSSKFGTMSLSTKMYSNVKDFGSFLHWVADDIDERLGFLTKKASDSAISEMFIETGELPPGIDTYMKTTLNKRKK